MTFRSIQYFLAFIFLGLGGWCVVAPHMAEALAFRPAYQDITSRSAVLIGCFGCQAVLVGTIMATAEFKPSTFLVFGLVGSLPFFGFNIYFYYVAEMFTAWMLLDVAGNIGILACGVLGFRMKRAELAAA